jgi:hypothetical protein
MAAEMLSMRQLREILRQKLVFLRTHREVAASRCSAWKRSVYSVHEASASAGRFHRQLPEVPTAAPTSSRAPARGSAPSPAVARPETRDPPRAQSAARSPRVPLCNRPSSSAPLPARGRFEELTLLLPPLIGGSGAFMQPASVRTHQLLPTPPCQSVTGGDTST